MFCPKCGTQNDDAVMFCANCGESLADQNTPNVTPLEPAAPMMGMPVEPVMSTPVTPVEPVMSTPVTPVEPVMGTPVTPVAPTAMPTEPVNNGFAPQQPVNNGFAPQQPVNNGFAPQQPINNQAAPKKGMGGLLKILIPVAIAVVALIVGVIVFVSIGNSKSDPKKTVEKYITSLTSGKYDEAYAQLELISSEFLSKEAFQAANANVGVGEISTLQIMDGYSVMQMPDSKTFIASYFLNIGKSGNVTLTVNKSSEKQMLFFDKYTIDARSMYVTDLIMVAPKGVTLKLNGIAVDAKYALDEERASEYTSYTSRATVYKIPYMFKGDVKVTLESDILKTYEYAWVCEEKDEDDSEVALNMYSIAISDLEYKDDVATALQAQAKKDIDTIIKAAIDNKEWSAVANMFTSDEDWQDDCKYDYEEIVDDLHYEGYSVSYDFTAIELKDLTATASVGNYNVYSNGQNSITVRFKYGQKGQFSYDDGEEIRKYEHKDYYTTSSSYAYYTYEDGAWKIRGMYIYLRTNTSTYNSVEIGTIKPEPETSAEPASEASSEASSASAA